MQEESFEPVAYKDHILNIGKRSNGNDPKFLKLKKNDSRFSNILKNSTVLSKLAKALAQHVMKEKEIQLTHPLFKSYYCALIEEKVIDTNTKKIHVHFIRGHDVSDLVKQFRKLFQEEAKKIQNEILEKENKESKSKNQEEASKNTNEILKKKKKN